MKSGVMGKVCLLLILKHMAQPSATTPAHRFLSECSGACGDLGTFIPHVVGAMTVAGLAPAGVLFGFAASQPRTEEFAAGALESIATRSGGADRLQRGKRPLGHVRQIGATALVTVSVNPALSLVVGWIAELMHRVPSNTVRFPQRRIAAKVGPDLRLLEPPHRPTRLCGGRRDGCPSGARAHRV
jgi:hypothetical protein